ncbi:two-component response regulator [[Actinomadura] parvosata subsp. kistnae]|uniref:DNA-binding response regulator n=1 Tax=[Actinomadura] parvosata subsp. kistnae TaxID=1909395 RepID=A0A1U9ZRY7_9ACTN|nr:response regulator transcription factor [Nonomuraea sp. ATCC 55076]AQZ60701.1 DNA-binding response regulator [Nonomuraea sp. ATCC 55076]SPL90692.1 two-component response regulator [Actinomadura parvosata subsp. kistnae]
MRPGDGAEPIRVMLVDDQILMREGLRKLLEIEPGIEIAATAGGGQEALAWLAGAVAGERPQVVLVDARMPGMDGVELVARLRAEFPGLAPVILTTFDDEDYIFGGLRAGAKGYLLKDTPPDELVAAIRRAARGETVLGGAASERLVALLRGAPAPSITRALQEPPGGLSEREYEIALLIGAGAANREIARRLHITEGTAKNHISSCLRKLGLRDRTQLAVWVSRHAPPLNGAT